MDKIIHRGKGCDLRNPQISGKLKKQMGNKIFSCVYLCELVCIKLKIKKNEMWEIFCMVEK